MVRPPYFDGNGMKKGAWSEEEDKKLRDYIQRYGHRNWRFVPIFAGLARCGKSCRLRWVNYLKPGLKSGNLTENERDLVIKLHAQLGNKWSAIAANFPGRTDNEIKNYWHGHIQKRRRKGNGAAGKGVIKTKMLKEDQSSEINSCNIPPNNINPQGLSLENLENIDVVNSGQQAHQGNEEYYQTCLSPLPEGKLIDNFWLCLEMQNDMWAFSEASNVGYNSTAETQLGEFWTDNQLFGEEAISRYFGDILSML